MAAAPAVAGDWMCSSRLPICTSIDLEITWEAGLEASAGWALVEGSGLAGCKLPMGVDASGLCAAVAARGPCGEAVEAGSG